MIICVDFDGTIVVQDGRRYDDVITPPTFLPGAREGLLALKRAGHTLVLWSGRARLALRSHSVADIDPLVAAGVRAQPRWSEANAQLNEARFQQMLRHVETELRGVFAYVYRGGEVDKPSVDMFIDDTAVRLGTTMGGQTWQTIAQTYGETTPVTGRYAKVLAEFGAHDALQVRLSTGLIVNGTPIGKTQVGPILRLDIGDVSSTRRLVVIAGQHGEEPAGVEAILRGYAEFHEAAKRAKAALTIYPCVNPEGYDRDQRYNLKGEKPTNAVLEYRVGGQPGWVDMLVPGELPIADRPVQYGARETRALHASLLGVGKITAVLDLHQDSALRAGEMFAYTFPPEEIIAGVIGDVKRKVRGSSIVTHRTFRTTWAKRTVEYQVDGHGLTVLRDGSFIDWLNKCGARLAVTVESSLADPELSIDQAREWVLAMIQATASERAR